MEVAVKRLHHIKAQSDNLSLEEKNERNKSKISVYTKKAEHQ